MRAFILFLALLCICEAISQTTYRRSGRAGPRERPPRASTYLGSAFGHTDSANTTGPGPQAVTPVASMKAGDLVIMIGINRSVDVDIFSVQLGGQTWDTTAAPMAHAVGRGQMQWCKYNGTWGANPSMQSASGTTGLSVGMWVFRPADTVKHSWQISGTIDTSRFAAPADSLATLTGKTTPLDSMIVIGAWFSGDDNAWAAGTAGWGDGTPGNGLKNISGTDLSLDLVYLIKAAAGASGNVSRKQIARGTDAGGKMIFMFR